MRTLDIEFEQDRSIDLGSTFGDGHTDRQTHTYTFLLSSDIRSEGSIAIVKKFDFDFFYGFRFDITPTV